VTKQIFGEWGNPTVDLFASAINSQAPFYYRAPEPDLPMAKGCLGEDSFAITWDFQETVYCNPPWKSIERAIEKIIKDKPRKIIFIAPVNPKLDEISKEKKKLKHNHNLFIPKSKQPSRTGIGNPPWKDTYAYLITHDIVLQNSLVAAECHELEKINFLDLKSYLPSPHCDQKPSCENMIKNYCDRDEPQRRQKG
jgi:hypothetical protein